MICFVSSSLRGTKQSYNDSIRIASYLAMTTVYIKRLKIFDKPKWKYNYEKVFKATNVTDFAANHSECL